jgi:hypothetical protein
VKGGKVFGGGQGFRWFDFSRGIPYPERDDFGKRKAAYDAIFLSIRKTIEKNN